MGRLGTRRRAGAALLRSGVTREPVRQCPQDPWQHARVRPRPVLAAVLVLAALAACTVSADVDLGPGVEPEKLATQVSAALEESVGVAPDDVECDDQLDARADATTRCVLTAGEERYGVTVTATEVTGDTVDFDVQVDDQPMTDES